MTLSRCISGSEASSGSVSRVPAVPVMDLGQGCHVYNFSSWVPLFPLSKLNGRIFLWPNNKEAMLLIWFLTCYVQCWWPDPIPIPTNQDQYIVPSTPQELIFDIYGLLNTMSCCSGIGVPDDIVPVYYAERSVLWLRFTCSGSPGHGSRSAAGCPSYLFSIGFEIKFLN